jgi:uncharacterized protein (DUF697 family)
LSDNGGQLARQSKRETDGVEDTKAHEAETATSLTKVLDTIWNGVVLADAEWSPGKSCFDLADEYRRSGRTPEECAANFIDWQTAKATATGFALGLPGLPAMVATVPADLTSTAYLQLRMVAVIGLLFGWDVRSDQFRSMAYISLLGTAGGELLRDFGVTFTTKLVAAQISKLSGKALLKINQAVGFKLLTKAGSTGLVNLTKIVPVLGGIVGGGVNLLVTRQIGHTALTWLKEGPGVEVMTPGAPEPRDGAGPIIEGVAG